MSLYFDSAASIATTVRNGDRDPSAIVDAFLDRIESRNRITNAYITLLREDARARN